MVGVLLKKEEHVQMVTNTIGVQLQQESTNLTESEGKCGKTETQITTG